MPVISAANDDAVKILGVKTTVGTTPGPGAGMAVSRQLPLFRALRHARGSQVHLLMKTFSPLQLELQLDPDCAEDMSRLQIRDSGHAEPSKTSQNHKSVEAAASRLLEGQPYDGEASSRIPPPRSAPMRRDSSANVRPQSYLTYMLSY